MIKCLSNNRWYMACQNTVISTEPSPCFDEIRLFHVWNNNGPWSTFMFEEQTSSYWASNMMFPSRLSNVPSNGTWQLSVGGCRWFSDTIFGFKFQSSGDYPTILAGEGTTTPRQVSKARVEEQRVDFFWKNIYKEARHIICIFFAVFASTLDPYPGQNRKVLCSLKHISTPSISSTSTSFRIFLHIYISATSRINHLHTKRSRICKTAWSWL